jgi:hypothetical protein
MNKYLAKLFPHQKINYKKLDLNSTGVALDLATGS